MKGGRIMKTDFEAHKYSSVSFVKDNCVSVGNSVGSNRCSLAGRTHSRSEHLHWFPWQSDVFGFSCVTRMYSRK